MTGEGSEGWQLPIEPYTTSAHHWTFRERLRRKVFWWSTHLGDDIVAEAGTPVVAIGDGEVVMAQTLLGSSARRNWGGLVVLQHDEVESSKLRVQSFYSVYGHLGNVRVREGEHVKRGQWLGEVAEGSTPENGWWKIAHLHFAIYTGPWTGDVLPGWWRPEQFWRTKLKWWHDPKPFLEQKKAPE